MPDFVPDDERIKMKYKKLNVTGLSQEHSVFYWVGGRRLRFPGEFLEADKSEKDRKWIVGYKTADIGKKQV